MFKKLISLLLMCCIIPMNVAFAENAASQSPVTIAVLSQEAISTDILKITVQVQFNDRSLMNDGIYLSYHIYGDTTNMTTANALIFDNQRTLVTLDSQNCFVTTMDINVTELVQQKVYIQMDLVDIHNMYWFSSKDNIEMPWIEYDRVRLSAFLTKTMGEIQNKPIIFLLNVVAFLLCIICYVFIRRNKILSFNRKEYS